ncbi:TrkH family potassium uptake protein [Lacticaseibacillus brantae]|uniref:Potassium uptake protein ktrB n=1 Tax=Lacticaseibacillus brantae DSM 23927 TaxID=1423727 RepID=A0A0R2B5G6_9LACO|nr:potassium transporter TrkG [Lacticaseibacillus brantae]KRM71691.1 potassium uptake protein ktrB [Lacticaseibacillus brantae DSM 23927]
MIAIARLRLSPPQVILISFLLMILIGACLLTLPIASQNGQSIGFLDALFTATSANCVTGLIVVNTMSHWSWFGKLVIITLIQLGGIGFMTVTTGFLLLTRQRIGLRDRSTIQAAFSQNSIGGTGHLVRRVLRYTAVIEGTGAILLTLVFLAAGNDLWRSIRYGIFHAISAFCNAGFDIIGDNSLVAFQTNWPLNLILMALIILGGLGFTVIAELAQLRHPSPLGFKRRIQHLSLHTKLVLVTTTALLVFGTVIFLLLEWDNTKSMGRLAPQNKVLTGMFESVTLRTAGFDSLNQANLTDYSKLIGSTLMFIGGSPASTAGGIKTISLAVLIIAVRSALRGEQHLVVFKRKIALANLQKALAIAGTLTILTLLTILVLHFSEANNSFRPSILDLIFETTSAVGTVGVTTGLTPHLSVIGKCVIALCMFIGRLSPITVAVALSGRLRNQSAVDYPEAEINVG